MFYLPAWSTSLPCLFVVGGIKYWDAGFSSNFYNGMRWNENEIVERWKFSFKMWFGSWECWASSFFALSVILRTFAYLFRLNLHKVPWIFSFVCLYDVPWASSYVHVIAEKKFFALLCVSNFVLIILLCEKFYS